MPDVDTEETPMSPRTSPLHIAIDANFLSMPNTGIGTYVRCLIAAVESEAERLGLVVDSVQPRFGKIFRAGSRAQRMSWDSAGVARATMAVKPRPDLLHIPQMSAPLITPFPVVVTIHDVIPLMFPEYRTTRAMQTYLAVMSRTARRARRIIVPSHASAADVAKVLKLPRDVIDVIPEAASPDLKPDPTGEAASRARYMFAIPGRYLFNLGGFDRRKNVPMLVRAFAKALPSLDDDLSLVIGGAAHSGNQRMFPPVAPLIEELGVRGRLILTGEISDNDRRILYQGATASVFPSSYEGFGLPVLESMACGVPVIASNASSIPEVAGDAGMLVEPSIDTLAAAITDLMTNENLRSDLRRLGLDRAALFSWRATAAQTAVAYRRALTS